MNRLLTLKSAKAAKAVLVALVASVLALSGCRPAGFFAPLGQTMHGSGSFTSRQDEAPRFADLLIQVRWPQRDLPGFKASTIPTTTNSLVITVSGDGREPVSKTVSRPEGPATEPVLVNLPVPEGSNLAVTVKAFRETAPVPDSAQPIAQGTVALPQAKAGKLVPVKITLTAMFAPTITGLSAYASPTGYQLGVTGTNFGSGSAPIAVKFGGKDGLAADPATLTRTSATQLTVRVSAQAVTGPLVVVADGIPSEEDTIFWVMQGEPDLKVSVNSNYNAIVLPAGSSASIAVEQNVAFRFPLGMNANDFTGKPDRRYTVSDSAVATVSVGLGLTDALDAKAAGTAAFKATLGSIESNPMSLTVTKGFVLQTIAGKGGGIGDGGSAATAELSQPLGIAVAPGGDLLVADQGHNRIRRLGVTASTEAGTGVVGDTDGAAAQAQFSSPAGVAMDASGSLYVADQGNHVIRKLSGGTVTTVAGSGTEGFSGDGSQAPLGQLSYPQGVALTPEGHLIIADTYNHRIRIVAMNDGAPYGFSMLTGSMYTLAGASTNGFGDGSRLQAMFDTPTAVAVDASGSVYVADSGNNRVRKINAEDGVVTTLAGDGEGDFSGDGGPATAARLFNPTAVVLDASGSIYVADTNNSRVRVFTEGATISTFAGTGTTGTAGDGGAASLAQLSAPKALVVAGDALYIGDFAANRIRKVVLSTGAISTAAGAGAADGTDALQTALTSPIGVTLDPSGKLVVIDTDRNVVRRLEGDNTFTIVAGTGVASFAGDGGDPREAGLNQPNSGRYDADGILYIVDSRNGRVRAIGGASQATVFGVTLQPGKIATVAGGGNSTFAAGPAVGNTLGDPIGVAFSADGDMFITDSGANSIYKVTRNGGQMTRIAGDGTAGYAGDNSIAQAAKLQGPRGVEVEADGGILFADGQNHAVRRIKNGIITTVAGNGTPNFTGDNGGAASAQLNSPWAVVLDGVGGFYISDSGNHALRWVTSTGTITTIAGTPTVAGFSGDDGAALAGKLFSPRGMVKASGGGLIFADTGNHRIRKITPQ